MFIFPKILGTFASKVRRRWSSNSVYASFFSYDLIRLLKRSLPPGAEVCTALLTLLNNYFLACSQVSGLSYSVALEG